ACIELEKDDPAVIRRQIEQYRSEGMPENYGLAAGTVLMRRHRDAAVIGVMEAWWAEIMQHSVRDQISLPFVAWRATFPLDASPVTTPSGPAYIREHHYVRRRQILKRNRIKESEVL